MKVKRISAAIVGITQSAIGIAAVILAFLLYFNFLDIQAMLNVSVELLPLNLLILGVFGFFSLISGFFLLYEG
jgi:hypothetical protein